MAVVAHRTTTTTSSPSSRVRLSLQTIFSRNLNHHLVYRKSSSRSTSAMSSSASSTTSSVRPSPSASFSSFRREQQQHQHPVDHLGVVGLSPILGPASSPCSYNYIRRQPSAIDLALEQEKYADHTELVGLGLLEPRPRANTSSTVASTCSMMEFMHESMQTPVVLDGIFEVLERA
ncbi:hypothetical protein ABEF95_013517 [Exophiala dermatitidis]|uniref:Uncharacterized protein n=1 Tax=Exophiala dermatitidis (strain ATCC 34100 / CBS 525.76 / NIH/UT8656) TaxID=858893 RepID=H6C8G0_EXODN|nr:uncharacterized protein HMPREF1120_08352 [Exophiala dermatitidis NIH/UT8656]EHY60388.1 hypothetical protein HMPREF1120_08352 [Exophiala dermatitidis NIH/UT8656]